MPVRLHKQYCSEDPDECTRSGDPTAAAHLDLMSSPGISSAPEPTPPDKARAPFSDSMGTAGAPGVVRSRRAVRSRSASSTTARSVEALHSVCLTLWGWSAFSSRVLSLSLDSERQHIVMSVPANHRQPCDERKNDTARSFLLVNPGLRCKSLSSNFHTAQKPWNTPNYQSRVDGCAISSRGPPRVRTTERRDPFATADVFTAHLE